MYKMFASKDIAVWEEKLSKYETALRSVSDAKKKSSKSLLELDDWYVRCTL